MSYRIARFGWLPDPLDYRDRSIEDPAVQQRLRRILPLTAKAVTPSKPKATALGSLRVDLRPWCSPVEDQGQIGSCTANAVVGALEYFERKTRGEHVDASRFFLYKVTRRYLGWDGRGDTGAFVRSTIKALRLFGVTPERYWPYDERQFDVEPQAFHYSLAQNFKALEYFRVSENVEHLKSVLRAGLPFAFGFTCFSSIDEPEVARTGIIPYPRLRDSVVGGHAVLALGYTDSHVLFRNSWGAGWGDRGYGFLPWTYFDQSHPLATDCWVLVNAAWVPTSEADADVDLAALEAAKPARKAPTSRRARPSPRPPVEEREPIVRITKGIDPLRAIPLRLGASGVESAFEDAPIDLVESPRAASLYLKSLELRDSFDFALFGDAENELYACAIVWDLSGAPPLVFPPKNLEMKGTYQTGAGDRIQFVGDGIQLWPKRRFKGGLFVRILILENDDDVRAIGERMSDVRGLVDQHGLTTALASLATGPTAGVLTAIATVASKLAGAIGDLLQKDGDDLVALFDGTYGAEAVSDSRTERYEQRGAAIELEFLVDQPAAAKAKAAGGDGGAVGRPKPVKR
jgi:C1A family cysteine protease